MRAHKATSISKLALSKPPGALSERKLADHPNRLTPPLLLAHSWWCEPRIRRCPNRKDSRVTLRSLEEPAVKNPSLLLFASFLFWHWAPCVVASRLKLRRLALGRYELAAVAHVVALLSGHPIGGLGSAQL